MPGVSGPTRKRPSCTVVTVGLPVGRFTATCPPGTTAPLASLATPPTKPFTVVPCATRTTEKVRSRIKNVPPHLNLLCIKCFPPATLNNDTTGIGSGKRPVFAKQLLSSCGPGLRHKNGPGLHRNRLGPDHQFHERGVQMTFQSLSHCKCVRYEGTGVGTNLEFHKIRFVTLLIAESSSHQKVQSLTRDQK